MKLNQILIIYIFITLVLGKDKFLELNFPSSDVTEIIKSQTRSELQILNFQEHHEKIKFVSNNIQRSQGNPAENFYNIKDPYFRLSGFYWKMAHNTKDSCQWFPHKIFTRPVEVDASNPDKKQVQGINTQSTEDDVYYHRFRIGFVGPTNFGVNAFALKSLINGESVESPGLTIPEAIEFIPDSNSNTHGGRVKIIAQDLVILRTDDYADFIVKISGSGTYELLNPKDNLWKISFNVEYDFSDCSSGIFSIPIVLYNKSNQPKPSAVENNCFEPVELSIN
ncbi:MAG: hypothetical protein AAGH46_00370 [Bacteroidota bacterium]